MPLTGKERSIMTPSPLKKGSDSLLNILEPCSMYRGVEFPLVQVIELYDGFKVVDWVGQEPRQRSCHASSQEGNYRLGGFDRYWLDCRTKA